MITQIEIDSELVLIIDSQECLPNIEFPIANLKAITNFKPNLIGVIEKNLLIHLNSFLIEENLVELEKQVVFITSRQAPPEISGIEQGELKSFVCSWNFFDESYSIFAQADVRKWAYLLMRQVYDSKIVPNKLEVVQLPFKKKSRNKCSKKFNYIIPHKGNLRDLDICLTMIEKSVYEGSSNTLVGIDDYELAPNQVESLIKKHEKHTYFRSCPSNVGPYPIRELLISKLADGYIIFQDSDDISTTNRASELAHALKDDQTMVGSHELIFDEITETLRVRRFPLDVNLALDTRLGLPLLHGTSALSVVGFNKTGGFSTNRRFSNDTQFLARCYFFLRIYNVDEFLYIRKIHSESLTQDPRHPLDGEIRQEIANQWIVDFLKVRNGELKLEDSSLKLEKAKGFSLLNI